MGTEKRLIRNCKKRNLKIKFFLFFFLSFGVKKRFGGGWRRE